MSGHTPRSDVDQISDECRLSARWPPTRCESAGRLLPSTSSVSPCLPLFRKHSPDGATTANSRRPYKCRLLLIYQPQRDERLSWPSSWLTYSGWVTHISGQLWVERGPREFIGHRPTFCPLSHATIIVQKKIQRMFLYKLTSSASILLITFLSKTC